MKKSPFRPIHYENASGGHGYQELSRSPLLCSSRLEDSDALGKAKCPTVTQTDLTMGSVDDLPYSGSKRSFMIPEFILTLGYCIVASPHLSLLIS